MKKPDYRDLQLKFHRDPQLALKHALQTGVFHENPKYKDSWDFVENWIYMYSEKREGGKSIDRFKNINTGEYISEKVREPYIWKSIE
jgi:hypothetical protein